MVNDLVGMPKVDDSYVIRNFHTICRTCLVKSSLMVNIFEEQEEEDDELDVPTTFKLEVCLDLKVYPNDGLPETMCCRCYFKLGMCYEFKVRSNENDYKLRKVSSKLKNSESSKLSNYNFQEPEPTCVNKLENSSSELQHSYNYNFQEPERSCINKLENSKSSELSSNYNSQDVTSYVNKFDNSKSSELNRYNCNSQIQTNSGDYIIEESIVVVVDPNKLYDSSEESTPTQQVDQVMPEKPEGESTSGSLYKNISMCQFCDKAFIVKERCKEHEQTYHEASLPYRCIECNIAFAQRTHYVRHAKFVHGNKKPYDCPDCDKTFCRRSDLKKHCIVHTGIKPYHCHYCLKSFSRKTNLTKHLQLHATQIPHMCNLCPRSFVAKISLQRHMLEHSGMKPYACRECPLTFEQKNEFIKHEKHHGSVSQESGLRHIANNQNLNDNIMVIDVNPYNILTISPITAEYDLPHLPDHILEENSLFSQIKQQELPFSKYQQSFPSKLKSTSNRNKTTNIKCLECLKIFASLDSYRRHVIHDIDHIGSTVFQSPFQCKVCFKMFPQQRELDQHIIVHSEMKLCSSGQCNKKFFRKDELDLHEQTYKYLTVNMLGIESLRNESCSTPSARNATLKF